VILFLPALVRVAEISFVYFTKIPKKNLMWKLKFAYHETALVSFIIVHPNITRYSKQLRMRIIHNRTIRMIIRLYKAIISINSIMEIYRLCPTLYGMERSMRFIYIQHHHLTREHNPLISMVHHRRQWSN
jgi:hypothetical protein